MIVQTVTLKLRYRTEDTPISLVAHASMIRSLIAVNLAVKDVKCEGIGIAEWEEEKSHESSRYTGSDGGPGSVSARDGCTGDVNGLGDS